MASDKPALKPASYELYGAGTNFTGPQRHTGDEGLWQEWNPTEESVTQVRGRHRVARQRSGMTRSGAVLGVGMVAAIGAGGIATAKEKDPSAVTAPDLATMANKIKAIPYQFSGADFSVAGGLADGPESGESAVLAAPLTQAGLTYDDQASGQTDAGEALRARILAQADQQQAAADQAAREAAARTEAEKAAKAAAEKAAEVKAEEEARLKAAAEAARRKAEEEARRKAEAERLARLAKSFLIPLSSYQLSSGFGAAGDMWSSNHTGQDFAAPTGTPVKAVGSGTIKEAGWAGSYGYRIVMELEDGTEIWYCHLSSMVQTGGDVTTGDVIGRVGSTGNSSGPHLHLEVRPGGGDPVDPLSWLRTKGLSI